MPTKAEQVLSRDLDLYVQFWDIVREGQPVVELNPLKRFVVLECTPGYLPENDDPAFFDDEDEAWTYLLEEVKVYVEHMMEVDFEVKTHVDRAGGYVHVNDGGLGRDFYINSTEPHDFP
jgi:hypothetical protein